MSERNYIYNPEEQTMIFTVDAKRHVRVAYNEGEVWYAVCDIAKLLLGYRAPGGAVNQHIYGAKLLRVPHISIGKRGYTNCNCITKDALKRLVKLQSRDPDVCDWVLNTLIPQAERQFARATNPEIVQQTTTEEPVSPAQGQIVELLDKLDQFIIAAVTLRRELQPK